MTITPSTWSFIGLNGGVVLGLLAFMLSEVRKRQPRAGGRPVDGELTIQAPKLEEFVYTSRIRCPACKGHLAHWALFKAWLMAMTASIADVHYCGGGKELTQPVNGIQAAISGVTEVSNPCAGVTEPHLHVKCRHCHFFWLMKTAKD